MATRLRRLNLREISLVKRGANPGARVLLHKSEDDMPNPLERMIGSLRNALQSAITGHTPEGEVLKSADDKMSYVDTQLEELSEALAAEPTEEPAVTKTADAPAKTDEDVLKGLPEPVQALIQKSIDAATAAEARAAAAEEAVAKAAEKDATTVRIAKAESMLGDKLAGKPAELADVLKALSPEQVGVLETIFKGVQAQIATGTAVTEEIGKSGAKPKGDAEQQLETLTSEIRKSHPEFTKEAAIADVLKEHPDLYEASLTAGKGE
jgi:hypothetical protein